MTETPPYGSLEPGDEHALYQRDRPAWYRYVAAAMGRKLVAGGVASIREAWPYMSREYQTAVWATLDEAGRDLVRAARAELELEDQAA